MIDSSEGYFNSLATGGYQPLLHRVSGTIGFKIDHEQEQQQTWCVTIKQGDVEVRCDPTDVGDADCVIAGPEDEFLNIFSGQDSFAAAYIRGVITV